MPCDTPEEAARVMGANRTVGDDTFGNVRVSTVFLGLDHSHGHGEPVLFETMVFGGKHDELMARYSTHTEALNGHREIVALVESSIKTGETSGTS